MVNDNGNGLAGKALIALVSIFGTATVSAIGHNIAFSGRIATLEANRLADKEQLDRMERSLNDIWRKVK